MYRIDLQGPGYVEVIDTLGSDLTIVNAARISFDAIAGDELTDKDRKLIRYLIKHEHLSPFRHAYVQLKISMPDVVARHIIKHQIGAGYTDVPWNEKSGRYKEYDEFLQPEVWRKQSENSKQGSAGPHENQEEVAKLYAEGIKEVQDTYQRLVGMGVAKEQARLILPFATFTEVVYTASLQALLHLVKLRDAPDAQQETQEYAKAIKTFLVELFPETMRAVEEIGNTF